MAKISIVVPVYKVEEYIDFCITSILRQSFTDFDLILVDDGSPDRCGEICEEYKNKDCRIHVIHKENGGLSDARNYGIEWALQNSDSNWLSFVDSDDYIHPRYLELLLFAAESTKSSVCCCYYDSVSMHNEECFCKENGSYITQTPEDIFCLSYEHPEHQIQNCAWAKLYKKTLFKELRYPFGRYYEDAFTTYKIMFEQTCIPVITNELYYYYTNPDSITRSQLSEKKILDKFYGKKCRLEFFNLHNYSQPFRLLYSDCCDDIIKCLLYYNNVISFKETALRLKEELFRFMSNIDCTWIGYSYTSKYNKRVLFQKRVYISTIKSDYHANKNKVGIIKSILYSIKQLAWLISFRG